MIRVSISTPLDLRCQLCAEALDAVQVADSVRVYPCVCQRTRDDQPDPASVTARRVVREQIERDFAPCLGPKP